MKFNHSMLRVFLTASLISFTDSLVFQKVEPPSRRLSCLRGNSLTQSGVSMHGNTFDENEADYIVIGSGIGGLSCAAMLSHYGYSVKVLESHYLPGGCAHTFEQDGYSFDAGPSLWNGMATRPYNPLREILELVGEGNTVQYQQYDGWVMHVPEGSFKFTVGQGNFEKVLEQFGGPNAVKEWTELYQALQPVMDLAVAVPPLALRCDPGVILTLWPYLSKLIQGASVASKVEGSFKDISKTIIKDKFLENWFEFLSFALSGLPADSTIAAAVAYTMRDLHQTRAALDYPIGGSGAVVDALIRGFTKQGKGEICLNTHVEEILIGDNQAVGVRLRNKIKRNNNNSNNDNSNNNTSNNNINNNNEVMNKNEDSSTDSKILKARRGVISNASVWDTYKLLPSTAVSEKERHEKMSTPRTGSFVHLHLGIDATGLPKDLESHYTVINQWSPIDAPQNHVIISIPSVLDPSLAPPGCHVIHAYAAANEPYEIWESMETSYRQGNANKAAYLSMKQTRCDFLWKAIERSIPDIRDRVKVELLGSPFTHSRFNRRYKGTFGPAWRAGKEKFPYPNMSIKKLFCCGDSVFPGIGVPAVAASGANAASSSVSVFEHLKMMKALEIIRMEE